MSGLLGPDGRPIRRDAPLIVDAFGRPVRADAAEALPAKPRLRALEVIPIQEGGREGLLLRDPLGIAEKPAVLRLEVLPLLQLLDGTRSVEEICTRIVTESGDPAHAEAVRRFVEDLDRLYLLESPRFEERRKELQREYRKQRVREPLLAGHSYPAERGDLEKFLAGHFAEAKAIRSADNAPWPENAATLAIPHLDLRRSGVTMALGMLAIPETPPPDLVLLFGTGHMLADRLVAATEKRLATPLGEIASDGEAFDLLLSYTGDDIRDEELAVRDEHSIEFAAIQLAYRFAAPPPVLTVVFGGFHRLLLEGRTPESDELYAKTVRGLRAVLETLAARGKRVLCLAAVDLSHVGARFGELEPLDEERLAAVKGLDEEALRAAASGDPDRWFETVASHGDSTSICGFSAMHALLAVSRPSAGRILRYEQSPEAGGSMVSCASLAWPA